MNDTVKNCYIAVIPNRGSQLAFLRLSLTFENPTKNIKKSNCNSKIILAWLGGFEKSLYFIVKIRGKESCEKAAIVTSLFSQSNCSNFVASKQLE